MYELARRSPLGREAPSPQDAARANVAAYEAMRAHAVSRSRNRNPARGLRGLERKPEE